MKLLHGSNRIFDKFIIDKNLMVSSSSAQVEGEGIYCSDYIDVCSYYGKHLYIIDVDDTKIFDFTKKVNIRKFLKFILKNNKINLQEFIDMNYFINAIFQGNMSIKNVVHQIFLNIECDYNIYNYIITKKIKVEEFEEVENILEENLKEFTSKYVLYYNVKKGKPQYTIKNTELINSFVLQKNFFNNV